MTTGERFATCRRAGVASLTAAAVIGSGLAVAPTAQAAGYTAVKFCVTHGAGGPLWATIPVILTNPDAGDVANGSSGSGCGQFNNVFAGVRYMVRVFVQHRACPNGFDTAGRSNYRSDASLPGQVYNVGPVPAVTYRVC